MKDLIKSAESFLSSANVESADEEKKIQFLKKKGLNDEEIDEAFKRVGGNTMTHQATNPTPTTITSTTNTTPKLPPRPTSISQILYYPPTPIPRMTTKQLLSYALIIGFSTFGITVTLAAIIKRIMSKILNSIANYQRDRYQQNTKLLKRVKDTLQDYTTNKDNSLETEQTKLNNRLAHLVEFSQTVKSDRANHKPYKGLKSNIERFRNTVVQNPFISSHIDYYGTGGLTSSYANRYQVANSHNAAIQNIKSEIRSFKGMLLSRRNFPTVSSRGMPRQLAIPPVPASPITATNDATTTIAAPASETMYHPRRRRSYRSELSTTATPAAKAEEVKDVSSA